MKKFWAYRHIDGGIKVKACREGFMEVLADAKESSFVDEYLDPFQAPSRKAAEAIARAMLSKNIISYEGLWKLLTLAGHHVDQATVGTWTDDQKKEAEAYGVSMLMQSGPNVFVGPPPKVPEFMGWPKVATLTQDDMNRTAAMMANAPKYPEYPLPPRKLAAGVYETTEAFREIEQHSCVCYEDDLGLVATTGPAEDLESQQLADFFANAPAMEIKLNKLESADFHIVIEEYEVSDGSGVHEYRASFVEGTEPIINGVKWSGDALGETKMMAASSLFETVEIMLGVEGLPE